MAGETMDTAETCVRYAHMAYLWLPLFLGFTGGLCMLISTVRKTLTAGTAAALASMSSVIVIATAAGYMATLHAHATGAMRPAMPEPQGLAGQHGMGFERAVQDHEQALEKLIVKIEAVERRLDGRPARPLPRPGDMPALSGDRPKVVGETELTTPPDSPPGPTLAPANPHVMTGTAVPKGPGNVPEKMTPPQPVEGR